MGPSITVSNDNKFSTVTVQGDSGTILVDTGAISVVSVGIQGPTGAPGAGDKHFEQAFTAASSVTVTHNLSKKPAVTVIDSAGDEVEGVVNHVSNNQLVVSFSASFTGTAICN